MQEVREIKSHLRPVTVSWGASSPTFKRSSAPQLTAEEQVTAILAMEEEGARAPFPWCCCKSFGMIRDGAGRRAEMIQRAICIRSRAELWYS